jgi:hypothetical protein
MLFHLQVSQFQFVPTEAFRHAPLALGTLKVVFDHREFGSTLPAPVTPGSDFDRQFEFRQIGIALHRIEAEA